jgi:hypothetical protein
MRDIFLEYEKIKNISLRRSRSSDSKINTRVLKKKRKNEAVLNKQISENSTHVRHTKY